MAWHFRQLYRKYFYENCPPWWPTFLAIFLASPRQLACGHALATDMFHLPNTDTHSSEHLSSLVCLRPIHKLDFACNCESFSISSALSGGWFLGRQFCRIEHSIYGITNSIGKPEKRRRKQICFYQFLDDYQEK